MGEHEDRYQGWANRETWCVTLHIGNDPGLWDDFSTEARRANNAGEYVPTAVELLWERWFTRAGYEQEMGDTWPVELSEIAQQVGSAWRVDWNEVAGYLLDQD